MKSTTDTKDHNLTSISELLQDPKATLAMIQQSQSKFQYEEDTNNLRTAIEAALEPPRGYERKVHFKTPTVKYSRFKLHMTFSDGTRKVYPSFERLISSKDEIIDEQEALLKLIRIPRQRYPDRLKQAHIFLGTMDNPDVNKKQHNNLIYSLYPDRSMVYWDFDFKVTDSDGYIWNEVDWLTIRQINDYPKKWVHQGE